MARPRGGRIDSRAERQRLQGHQALLGVQRHLEPVRVYVRAVDDQGNELQRSEPEPITKRDLSWMSIPVTQPCTVEFCIIPALPVPLMPLEYAVWEPIL